MQSVRDQRIGVYIFTWIIKKHGDDAAEKSVDVRSNMEAVTIDSYDQV